MNQVALSELLLSSRSGYWGGEPGGDEGDVKVIRNGDVKPESGIQWDRLPARTLKSNEVAKSLVVSGDLVITTSGDCGVVAMVEADPPSPTCASNFIRVLRVDQARVHPRYLFHFTQTSDFANALRPHIRGTTLKNLAAKNAFSSVSVPLPGLDEQRRIATILDKASLVRAKRHQALAYLDELTQSIFLDMFGDPRSNRMGWPLSRIGDVADVVTGNSPSRADEANFGRSIEWIKSDNLGGQLATVASEWLSEVGRARARVAPTGSVLVTCIAGSPTSIGKCSLVDRPVAFNQQINAVLPSPGLDMRFLLAQFKTAPDLVRAKSTGGMKGLVSKSAFQSIRILLPPKELQLEYQRRASSVDKSRASAQEEAKGIEAMFGSLQSRAFRGEL